MDSGIHKGIGYPWIANAVKNGTAIGTACQNAAAWLRADGLSNLAACKTVNRMCRDAGIAEFFELGN